MISLKEFDKILNRIENLLTNITIEDFSSALRVQISALSSWGEILELPRLVHLTQCAMHIMKTNPENSDAIGRLVLDCCHMVYDFKLKINEYNQILSENNLLFQNNISETILERKLRTSNLFIWRTGDLLLTLPSDWIAEIVIPRPGLITPLEQKRCLNWRDQFIPIYQLFHYNDGGTPHVSLNCEVNDRTEIKSERVMILVIKQGDISLALDLDIDSLVTKPELTISLYSLDLDVPQYFYGYILNEESNPVTVINLAQFLEMIFQEKIISKIPEKNIPRNLSANSITSTYVKYENTVSPLIMIVDDSHTLRYILNQNLINAGYEVIEAQDGQEALQLLQTNNRVQLVICDLEMPNMNGFEFLSHCRRDPLFIDLPIVMLSTFNEEGHRSLARKLGANAYFSKPYNEMNFMEDIRDLIEKPSLKK